MFMIGYYMLSEFLEGILSIYILIVVYETGILNVVKIPPIARQHACEK